MQGQFTSLDRTDGDIDALSSRLARVRTLAYVANRADWLADPQAWQGRARNLEDRLSDTLHQSLMQRFVDRRTSALLRSLNQRAGPILGGIDPDGAVTVEGHLVGRLAGFHFEAERGETALENRALRGAVERVVAPEVARRLGALASESDEAFALASGGVVTWRGEVAGEIIGGEPFAPRVRLIGEFGAEPQRERAARRLEAFAAAEASERLSALKQLKEAIEDGRLKGLARGLAYELVEQFGALDRRAAEARIRLLSRNERRTLKALGVRFGAFSLYLPSLLEPKAQRLAFAYADLASPAWRPDAGTLNPLPRPIPRPQALALRGLCAVGQFAAPIAELERLDALARAAWPEGAGAIDVTDALLASLEAGGATTRITSCARLATRACATAKARSAQSFAGAARRPMKRRRGPGRSRRHSPRSPRLRSRTPPPRAGRGAPRPGAVAPRDAPFRDGRRGRRLLPDRRLAVARPLFQDEKPCLAGRRRRRRTPHTRLFARPGRQAEPLRPLRRRLDLRARVAMARGQDRSARRTARPGD